MSARADGASVVALLAAQAATRPDAIALVEGRGAARRTITVATLDDRARRLAAWLAADGLSAGDAVLVVHQPTIDLYVLLVALFRLGAVAMFVDLGAGRAVLEAACAISPPAAAFLGPRAQLLRLASPALRRVPRCYTSGRWPLPFTRRIAGAAVHAPLAHDATTHADTPALLTFTSGSTGAPRAACRTHGFLRAQHDALVATILADTGARDLVAFPVVVLANLARGVTSVLPDADLRRPGAVDAPRLLAQCAAERPTRLSAPPAMLARLVAASAPGDARWGSVREVVTGGGPVFPDLLDALARVAPHARRLAVYGSTEAEPIAELDAATLTDADRARMADGDGLPAGTPVAPVRLRVIASPAAHGWRLNAATFDALARPPGVPGEIVVTGAHVLRGYWRGTGDEETKLRVGDTVWHRTGDVGALDADGRLRLLGRATATITDARGTAYPFAAECALRLRWPALRAALVAHAGERVLVVERDGAPDDAALRACLAFMPIDAVVRHNSKVDYPRLARLLGRERPGAR